MVYIKLLVLVHQLKFSFFFYCIDRIATGRATKAASMIKMPVAPRSEADTHGAIGTAMRATASLSFDDKKLKLL
jgi:hypothetical protein